MICRSLSQGIVRQNVDADRRIQVCPAALSDLRMLLPRHGSRAIVIRHARKLQTWRRGSRLALDLEVADIQGSVIHELCVGDCFGFPCGLRLAFFEDTLTPPDGQIWLIGSRRDDEPLSERMIETLNHRMEIIEEKVVHAIGRSGECED
jgi:hypothetical protein